MRKLKHYKTMDWLKFQPLVDAFKNSRNDLYSFNYCKKIPKEHAHFLANLKQQNHADNIVISIAYNCVETITLLIDTAQKNINNSLLIIADNSSSSASREAIKELCKQHGVPYIGLPSNKTKHANRSHSLAIQWCYVNIIALIKPEIFTFLDHDLFPKKAYDFKKQIKDQPFYGTFWNSNFSSAWQLWAGFCTFRYAVISKYKLNFLYDFANGLDTGGRNYSNLYQYFDKETLNFSSNDKVCFLPDTQQPENKITLQIIDDCWVHMGGAGHRAGYEERHIEFLKQMDALDHMGQWSIYSSKYFTSVEPFRHKGYKVTSI